MVIILGVIAFLAVSGVRANKSYYVTIQELKGWDRRRTLAICALLAMCCRARFAITGPMPSSFWSRTANQLHVSYQGEEPPPDTFKDNAQALASRHLRTRWRLSRDAAAGEVRVEVCSRTGREARYDCGDGHGGGNGSYHLLVSTNPALRSPIPAVLPAAVYTPNSMTSVVAARIHFQALWLVCRVAQGFSEH